MDVTSYLIAGFIAAFLGFNLLPLWRAWRVRGRHVPALAPLLTARQRRQRRLLVYFWSPRCGICRSITPVIDRLAGERPDVVKIDIAAHAAVARGCGVMATPSFALVRDGLVEKLLVGGKTEAQIRALLAPRE
jgi:thioredoxin 1